MEDLKVTKEEKKMWLQKSFKLLYINNNIANKIKKQGQVKEKKRTNTKSRYIYYKGTLSNQYKQCWHPTRKIGRTEAHIRLSRKTQEKMFNITGKKVKQTNIFFLHIKLERTILNRCDDEVDLVR